MTADPVRFTIYYGALVGGSATLRARHSFAFVRDRTLVHEAMRLPDGAIGVRG
jgi:hypothetical protein